MSFWSSSFIFLFYVCMYTALQPTGIGAFFSSSSKDKSYPHDMKSQSQLTGLYNQRVKTAEHVQRPLGRLPIPLGPISHSGVRVTLENGEKYLIHKGSNFGRSSQTVVVDAKHMSNKWKVLKTKPIDGKTVSDFVKKGGPKYSIFKKNCHKAARNMMG